MSEPVGDSDQSDLDQEPSKDINFSGSTVMWVTPSKEYDDRVILHIRGTREDMLNIQEALRFAWQKLARQANIDKRDAEKQ